MTSRLINGSADSRQDSDNFSSYSGAREAAACEWCGGPRGAFCKQINSFVASCIRTCLCIKCCCCRCDTAEEKYRRVKLSKMVSKGLHRRQSLRNLRSPRRTRSPSNSVSATASIQRTLSGLPTYATEPSSAELDDLLLPPARCCCVGHEAAWNRVQVSRCLVWMTLMALITGFLPRLLVNVYYSYFI